MRVDHLKVPHLKDTVVNKSSQILGENEIELEEYLMGHCNQIPTLFGLGPRTTDLHHGINRGMSLLFLNSIFKSTIEFLFKEFKDCHRNSGKAEP